MKIRKELFDEIVRQARAELPNEACGYVFGQDGVAEENYVMTNADQSPEHFSFVPQEQFDAVRAARARRQKIVGNWHSHPSSPARPSQEDIRLAYDPNITYFILSLAEETPVLHAFRIQSGEVEKIELEFI